MRNKDRSGGGLKRRGSKKKKKKKKGGNWGRETDDVKRAAVTVQGVERSERKRGRQRQRGEKRTHDLPPGVLNHFLTHANLLSLSPTRTGARNTAAIVLEVRRG